MAKKPEPKKRESKITVPERCHPFARLIFQQMNVQGKTYADIEWESGVLLSTLKSWRNHSKPGLETVEACLGALGWSLVPVPRMEKLPAKVQAALDELAEEWAREEPVLHQLLATACRAPFIVRTGRTDRLPRAPKGAVIEGQVVSKSVRRKSTEPNPLQVSFLQ